MPVSASSAIRFADAEKTMVEARWGVKERAPARDRAARHACYGLVVVVGIPALLRDIGNEVNACQQRAPQGVRRVDISRQSAANADNSNRSHNRDLLLGTQFILGEHFRSEAILLLNL
jgi:hypothetical protein